MISVLIFDLDGTLIDSAEYFFAHDQEVFRLLGLVPSTREEYFAHFGVPHHELLTTLRPDIDLKEYDQTSASILDSSKTRMFPEARAAIERFRKEDYRLGVLSAGKVKYVQTHLRNKGVLDSFEHIHGADSSPYTKPDPRVFDDILEYFREPKENVMYVGDMIADYEAANAAGIRFVGVTTGQHDENRFRAVGCKTVIASLEELDDVLSKFIAAGTR